jgi:hypothetical protein
MFSVPDPTSRRAMRVASQRGGHRRRERRGATILLVALTLTVLLAMAGLAVDFARMYVFKAQLKTLADAAALSAVTDLKNGAAEGPARTRASDLREGNRVEGALASIAAADIEPGTWVIGTPGSFVPGPWTGATAVRVTARYTADFTLGRAIGAAAQTISETSVAALGSYVSSACVAPFAIPYNAIVNAIGPAKSLPLNLLSPSDLENLASSDSVLLEAFDDIGRDNAFAFVSWDDDDGNPRSIAQMLEDAIDGCTSGTFVQVGDELRRVNSRAEWEYPFTPFPRRGEATWNELCGGVRGNLDDCTRTLQVPIVVPPPAGTTDPGRYVVQYIGALQIARIDILRSVAPRPRIRGRLTIDTQGGGSGYSPYLGPVSGIALVR